MVNFIAIPSAANDVRESVKWYGKQPGHLTRADMYFAPNFFSVPFTETKQASWDGTMN
jgi:hypothetical protein